jgi:hypothetical protein
VKRGSIENLQEELSPCAKKNKICTMKLVYNYYRTNPQVLYTLLIFKDGFAASSDSVFKWIMAWLVGLLQETCMR